MTLDANRVQAHLFLGLSYFQAEEYKKSLEVFQGGLRVEPGNAELHFNIGAVYDKLNRFNDLVRSMEETIRLNPEHANALNYLGYSYADRGVELEVALDLIRRALVIKPNDGYYLDSLGWAYYKLGKMNEALVELKRAASRIPDDPVIQEHLGEVYLKKSLLEEAKEAWLTALELDPKNQKLVERYRTAGFGDPEEEDRIQKALLQSTSSIPATPDASDGVHESQPSQGH